MKSYFDYEAEYQKAIEKAQPKDYIIKKDIWISCRWQKDVGFIPGTAEADYQLEAIRMRDERLWQTVIRGIAKMLDEL